MRNDVRQEKLISQHIDVALVYKEMLGLEEARAYLDRENIPREIADRVLLTEQKRGANGAGPAEPHPKPVSVSGCRRRNRIHDAIVEAALKLERKCGRDWALALLRDERVPEAVAMRVLAQGPRQLRTRSAGDAGTHGAIIFAR
ncbi:hypothetical protein LK542_16505 [Massilia sp. IC2-477]|uniref:hypothetical protein n=1 Tax=unclassified Massilia TaxID=2609279 RepID=UPI001D104D9D|nr:MULTISPECIES: hypothetical protein [unclassified Massilia]MCC2957219.1 hypothetical protein [Massilia sp. IC2-477]MCC2971027.1 hypothetical protein [Massilia sp. IC2-476]